MNAIVYFSWSGHTKRIVETISKNIKADIFEIDRQPSYSRDYNECAYHEAKDEVEQHIHPQLKSVPDMSGYDKIILAFPIWWYTAPQVIFSFLESQDFGDKDIYLFANSFTDDSQYMDTSLKEAKKYAHNGHIKRGLFNGEIKNLKTFIKENKLDQ